MLKDDEYSEPPYEVLCLLGPYMDPETLSVASCVSTVWSQCFSSENLWKHVLTSRSENLPSNLEVAAETMERFSYKRLVSIVETDAKRHRKNHQPKKPKISLSDLMFILHVSTGSLKKTDYKKGKNLDKFQIEVDVSNYEITSGSKDVRFTWQVVYKDWEKLLTVADITRTLDAKYGWFTDELPVKERCSSACSKLVGDVKTSYNGEVLEKIGFAIVNSNDWRSLLVDDVLRYFQSFFV